MNENPTKLINEAVDAALTKLTDKNIERRVERFVQDEIDNLALAALGLCRSSFSDHGEFDLYKTNGYRGRFDERLNEKVLETLDTFITEHLPKADILPDIANDESFQASLRSEYMRIFSYKVKNHVTKLAEQRADEFIETRIDEILAERLEVQTRKMTEIADVAQRLLKEKSYMPDEERRLLESIVKMAGVE